MVTVKMVFNVMLSLRLALATVPLDKDDSVPLEESDDYMGPHGIQWYNVALSALSLVLIMVVSDSLLEVSRQLVDPWGADVCDLPAGEYALRCLQGHKTLFDMGAHPEQPMLGTDGISGGYAPAQKRSLFLEPLSALDAQQLKRGFNRFAFKVSKATNSDDATKWSMYRMESMHRADLDGDGQVGSVGKRRSSFGYQLPSIRSERKASIGPTGQCDNEVLWQVHPSTQHHSAPDAPVETITLEPSVEDLKEEELMELTPSSIKEATSGATPVR